MRKLLYLLLAVVVTACQKDQKTIPSPQNSDNEASIPHQRSCATDEAVKEQIQIDPHLRERMNQIERLTKQFEALDKTNAPGTNVEIPVVIHVLYNNAEENISDAQIQSQIDVLNEDFNLRNADRTQVPRIFSETKADIEIRFFLKQIIRRASNKTSWPANDGMKYTQKGGSDVVDPEHNLNIWVCDLQKYLGYAYYPGIRPELDGIVVWYKSFGRTGTLAAPYNKGRTATHEIGHYLNLRHIWGDATCGTDLVDDTPQHTTANFGCPAFPHFSNCNGLNTVEMTMNYMDYTDDPCMYMFSKGQKTRMHAVFTSGGGRENLPL